MAKKYVLAVGDSVLDLKANATGGKNILFKELAGKTVVLYFYPKDDTPGCTLEGQDFAKLYPKLKKKGVEVFGISRDSITSHEKFKSKMKFPFELLSDEG